jgi:hypothetical protein
VVVRRPDGLVISSNKVQKLMRESARAKGQTAEFFTLHLAPSTEFHVGDEFSDQCRYDLRKILFDDFPELSNRSTRHM